MMKQPNNLRNRWRRYAGHMEAYGWSILSFREWAAYQGSTKSALGGYSYSVQPGSIYDPVKLRRALLPVRLYSFRGREPSECHKRKYLSGPKYGGK